MKKIITFILICFVLTGCTSKISVSNVVNELSYANNSVGYKISYRSPWRIADAYSKYISTTNYSLILLNKLGCNESLGSLDETEQKVLLEKDKKCLADKSAEVRANDKKIASFENNWQSGTSEYISLTDLSETEELSIIDQIKQQKISPIDLPADHFIEIYPSDLSLKFEQEKLSGKIIRKFFYLSDGTKTYLTEMPELKPARLLVIVIPQDYYSPISATTTKSLVIKMSSMVGSDKEKDFFDIAKSLQFISK